MDVVLVRLLQGADAVLQHRAGIAEDQGHRQSGVGVLARQDLIVALVREQSEPGLVITCVEQRAVFGKEVEDRVAIDRHRTAPAGSMPSSSA